MIIGLQKVKNGFLLEMHQPFGVEREVFVNVDEVATRVKELLSADEVQPAFSPEEQHRILHASDEAGEWMGV